MAYTYLTSVTYKATGTQTNFAIPFDYLRAAFVYVDVDGVNLTSGFEVNNRVLVFAEAPTEGSLIKIYRQTPTKRLVSWADASILKARDMEIARVQELHILEEQQDKANVVLSTANDALTDSKLTLDEAKKIKEAAATSATNAIAANKEAQQAKEEVKQIYNNGMLTPISDLAGSVGTELKRWGTIFANKVFASNLPLMYNSVSDMKADRKLKAGMTACTLGYYEPNDGGAGTYIIRAKQDEDVDDGGSLHEISGKLVAELVVENGTVNVKQFGAKGDGVSDDTQAIQRTLLLDYKLNISLSNGHYKVTDTLTIDVYKHSFIGVKATLDFSICNKSTAINVINTGENSYLNADKILIKNITLLGNKNNTGIMFDYKTGSTAHLKIENCNIANFKTGIYLGDNAYALFFYCLNVFECDVGIYNLKGVNKGENISFATCSIFNNRTGIINDSTDGQIYLSECSLDYNTIGIINNDGCIANIVNSHLENRDSTLIQGSANINNCYIVLMAITQNAVPFIVKDKNNIIYITNTLIDTMSSQQVLCQGNGKVIFKDMQSRADNYYCTNYNTVNSNTLFNIKLPFFAFLGTGDRISYSEAPNQKIEKDISLFETGTYSFKITKEFGGGSISQSGCILAKCRNTKNYLIRIRYKVEKECQVELIVSDINLNYAINNYIPDFDYINDYGSQMATFTVSDDWQWIDLPVFQNDVYGGSFILLVLNLFKVSATSINIDRVELYEY